MAEYILTKTLIISIKDKTTNPSFINYLENVIYINNFRLVLNVTNLYYKDFYDVSIRGFCVDKVTEPFCITKTLLDKTHLYFYRMSKVAQQQLLVTVFKDAENFKYLQTVNSKDTNRKEITSKRLIFKPNYGARSVGMIVIDQTLTNPYSVFSAISKSNTKKDLENILKNMPCKPSLYKGYEREKDEGFKSIKEDSICQEFVENVKDEFRIITGYNGMPVISILRKRIKASEDKDSHQVPSPLQDIFSPNDLEKLYPEINSELLKLFSKILFPIHSFDIFVTEDGKWGIFEFSPDFSSIDYPPGLLITEAKKFLEHYLIASQD